MSREKQQEGIVLRSFDYKDNQKIITVFTQSEGLITLIVKGINRKKTHLLTLTAPFTQAEYLYTIHRSDLYTFRDGTPLNTHSHIRKTFSLIEAASLFANALLTSQMPGKSAPLLYSLTLVYLKQLAHFEHPTTLTASFLLKLLKHEGHLDLTQKCTTCGEEPTHLYLAEPYCRKHVPPMAKSFTPSEWDLLYTLTESRNLKSLEEIAISPELHQKIEEMVKEKCKER